MGVWALKGLDLSQMCCILIGNRKHRRSVPVPSFDRAEINTAKPGEGKVGAFRTQDRWRWGWARRGWPASAIFAFSGSGHPP